MHQRDIAQAPDGGYLFLGLRGQEHHVAQLFLIREFHQSFAHRARPCEQEPHIGFLAGVMRRRQDVFKAVRHAQRPDIPDDEVPRQP